MSKKVLLLLFVMGFAAAATPTIRSLGFTAPVINDVANVPNPRLGDIAFDTSDGLFKGYDGGWSSFGGTVSGFSQATATVSDDNTTISVDIQFATAAGGSFNLDLPGPLDGKVIKIKRTDSVVANTVTITGTAGATIDGASSIGLYTEDEEYTLVGDGTDWKIVTHNSISPWSSFTMTFNCGTCAVGSPTLNEARARRVGDSLEMTYNLVQSGAGTAGSGVYLYTLPYGVSADTAKISPATNGTAVVGNCSCGGGSPLDNWGLAVLYDSTHVACILGSDANAFAFQSSSKCQFSGIKMSLKATIPISGWKN